MRIWIPILLISAPLAEVAGFVLVGGALGLWPTLGLTVLSAALGVLLVRAQGTGVVRRGRAALERGEAPVRELFDGLLLALAGALLFLPGFVSDAAGLFLLIPPVRGWLMSLVPVSTAVRRRAASDVIEGEWTEVRSELPPRAGE